MLLLLLLLRKWIVTADKTKKTGVDMLHDLRNSTLDSGEHGTTETEHGKVSKKEIENKMCYWTS